MFQGCSWSTPVATFILRAKGHNRSSINIALCIGMLLLTSQHGASSPANRGLTFYCRRFSWTIDQVAATTDSVSLNNLNVPRLIMIRQLILKKNHFLIVNAIIFTIQDVHVYSKGNMFDMVAHMYWKKYNLFPSAKYEMLFALYKSLWTHHTGLRHVCNSLQQDLNCQSGKQEGTNVSVTAPQLTPLHACHAYCARFD